MKQLFFRLIPFTFAFALVGCVTDEDGDNAPTQRSASDGAGYGGDSTFIREQDPISRHQQHLRGNY
ncbi:MAG: hypothetical protein ACI8UO_001255 [Verrucomicrobiales bacterium]|jgi:hypothetical protein